MPDNTIRVCLIPGVPRAPQITEDPLDSVAAPVGTAVFSCSASGQPSPHFSWYHGDVELVAGGQVSVVDNGGRSTLTLTNVGEGEEGEYYCEAENSQGTAESERAELQLACESKYPAHYSVPTAQC